MRDGQHGMRGIGALCVLAGVLVLTGCPKKPTETAAIPGEKVKPPATATPSAPESPAVKEPTVREEIIGVGKSMTALKLVYFDFDKSDIRADMKPVLQEDAKWLLASKETKAQIEGHSDERGTNEYNLALGARRAESVKRYLIALGVPASRLSTISYGEERPVCSGHDEACYSKNRRGQFAEPTR